MNYKTCSILCFITTLNTFAGPAAKTVPFTQVIKEGGWPMGVLGLLSAFATFLVVYFFITLRENLLMPEEFQTEAEDAANTGNIDELSNVCRRYTSAGSNIIGSAAQMMQINPDADYHVIRSIIEDEGSRQANSLWQRIQYLMDIAIIAPMVGLLGTVLGMIQAFVGLQTDFGAVKPIALASGVSKALVTTAGGLIVGIICMLLYSYFRGHVSRLIAVLEERCNTIIHHMIFNKIKSP